MGKADALKKSSQRNIDNLTAKVAEEKKPREKAFSGHGVSKVKTIKTSITVPEDVLHGMQTLARMKRSTRSSGNRISGASKRRPCRPRKWWM